MKWSLFMVVALLATACSGPNRTDRWTVERQAPLGGENSPAHTICGDIESLALGSLAGETDIDPVLDELARVGAIVGATDALPHLAAARDAEDPAQSLAAAATDLDAAGYAECEIPIFTALYVSTSWADCFGTVDIPASTSIGADSATQACNADNSPGFLPCWDVDAGYQPVDCRTGEAVRAEAGNWVEA